MSFRAITGAAVTLSVCWAMDLVPGWPGSSASAAQPLVVDAKRVVALQREAENPSAGRYDWGSSVMKDGEVYRMWWTRLGGGNTRRFPYRGTLPDGESYEFTYPDWGDRIYYASGLGFKDQAYTWDLYRCEVEVRLLERAW